MYIYCFYTRNRVCSYQAHTLIALIGLAIAVIFRRIIDFLKRNSDKACRGVILILIIFYGILILILFGQRQGSPSLSTCSDLPDLYRNTIEPAIKKIANNLMEKFPMSSRTSRSLSGHKRHPVLGS